MGDELVISHINVNGWNVNNSELRKRIVEFRHADIICINETHLHGTEQLKLDGFIWLGHNRKSLHVRARRAYGGVGLFVKDWLYSEYKIEENYKIYDDMLGIMFTHKVTGYRFMIYSVYLPPENSTFYNNAPEFFNRLLIEVYKYVDIDALYFIGDVNSRIGSLNDCTDLDNVMSRKNLEEENNNHGKAFVEFLHDSKCCVVNSRVSTEYDNFTSVSTKGKAVVDFVFTPHENLKTIHSCYVDTCSDIINTLGIQHMISDTCKAPDHSLVTIKIYMSRYTTMQCRNIGARNYYESTDKPKFNVRRIPENFMNSDTICNVIAELIENITLARENQASVDVAYNKVVEVVYKEMKDKLQSVSKSHRRKNTPFKPYWTDELSKLWKAAFEKEQLFLKYKGHRNTKKILKQDFITTRNTFDKTLRKKQRAYRRGLLLEIEDCDTSDPRRFWRHIHKLGPRKSNSIPWEVYDKDGNICFDKDIVLESWKSDYSSLFNNNNGVFDDQFLFNVKSVKAHRERNMQEPLYTSNNILNKTLELDEIRKVVNKAKCGKACGIDGIPNEVLKNENMTKCMHSLFQMCFDFGMIPSEWTKAIICPIPKSSTNDPRVPLNYRGLSILNCMYKIYSSVLNNRVLSYFEDNGILHEEQNGFRRKRSCNDHIFTLSSIIKNKMNNGTDIFAAFVDFRKAFDYVHRDMLLYRLLEYGVDGNMYSAIRSIYKEASCAVRVNNTMTDWFETTQGVKQGDNLSPTCFISFINPLIGALKATEKGVKLNDITISVLAYADDLVLLAENENDLQSLLDTLFDWCSKWRLSINVDKTKVMHFRPVDSNRTNFDFNVNGVSLEIVEQYKYLGILLQENLDFTKTAEMLSGAAGRALGSIINKVKANKDLGYNTFTTLIDRCVMPILLYGSCTWGTKYYKCCEDIILRACRFYMGVHRLAAIPGIQGDMGWLDCKSRWKLEIIRQYNRFINMDQSRLNRTVFMYDKLARGHNWNKKVKKILTDCDMLRYWNSNQPVPLDLFKTKIYNQFETDWEHHCSTKPKLRTYISFKHDIKVASHISCNMSKYERSLISQLRLGILPLRIETGRFSNLKVEERTCLICNSNNVENESHFLFECESYANERVKLEQDIGCNFSIMNENEKFKSIFEHPFRLAKYIKIAIIKRRERLYINS